MGGSQCLYGVTLLMHYCDAHFESLMSHIDSVSKVPCWWSCREWAEGCQSKDETYFSKWATSQEPQYFYIGCADSRVSVSPFTAP